MKIVFNHKKKAALFAAVMGSLMGYGTVAAANLAVAVPSDYSASQMGAVTGSRVTTEVNGALNAGVVTDLNRDPATFAVNINGEAKIFTRQYGYSTAVTVPNILFDAENLNKDASPQGPIDAVPNAHAAAGYKDLLFATGYDLGKIGVAQVTDSGISQKADKTVDLKTDIIQKARIPIGDMATVHGEGLSVNGNRLFALASINAKGGYSDYEDGVLLQYDIEGDGTLQYVGYTRVGKNTDVARINWYNGNAVISAIGGMQNYGDTSNGEESYITVADTVTGRVEPDRRKTIHMPKDMEDGKDFRDVKVLPNGTVYIMKYNLTGASGENESGFEGGVYKTTMANLLADKPKNWEKIIDGSVASNGGWFGKLDAEYYTKRLWVEWGNQLLVYTDGDKNPSYRWDAADFSTDTQYYQFNSMTMLPTDTIFGDLAQLSTYTPEGLTSVSETVKKIINANASNRAATRTVQITGSKADANTYSDATSDYSKYTFHKDETISLGKGAEGNYDNNILAAVFAYDGSNVNIDASGHTLHLEASNLIATPVGIYAGSGRNVSIKADQVNVTTSGLDAGQGGNSLTNAIWADGGYRERSSIQIDGNVNISMKGGYGGNGIAVQKTDRWGENSQESTTETSVIINGDVSIAGADNTEWGIPANLENVYSRFNNAGILTNIEKGKVIVNGNVDFSVYGNGITTNAKNSSVSIGGGHITVPKGMKYGYYTLGAYQGTINVNAGTDGQTPGKNDVQLDGDIFVLSTGTVNAALTTKSSYLSGIIDNGGYVNLWLQNGASWTNAANNTRYKEDNEDTGNHGKSRVTYFHGGNSVDEAGVIFQEKSSDTLTIDNYSGYTTLLFNHDDADPSHILGGDVRIGKAEKDSFITLRTDYADSMSSEKTQSSVLNGLARKLFYEDYLNGGRQLKGKVEIAEGLTASSAAKVSEELGFDDAGQGYYGSGGSIPVNPNEQSKTEFTTPITGGKDQEYADDHVLKDGVYTFTKGQTTIRVNGQAGIDGSQNNVNINAENSKLSVISDETGIYAAAGKKVDLTAGNLNASGKTGIDAAGTVVIHGASRITGTENAIHTNGSGNVTLGDSTIDGSVSVGGGTLNLNGKTTVSKDTTVGGTLQVTGKAVLQNVSSEGTVIVADKGNLSANGISIHGGMLNVHNGDLSAQSVSLADGGNASLEGGLFSIGNINVGSGSSLKITGAKGTELQEIQTGDNSSVSIVLNGSNSSLEGNVSGTGSVGLTLSNGAVWNGGNPSLLSSFDLTLEDSVWNRTGTEESSIAHLKSQNGVIYQKENTGTLRIGQFNGNASILFNHDKNDPTKILGGKVYINSGYSDGSSLILKTDNEGLNTSADASDKEKNLVNATLDALAKQLYVRKEVGSPFTGTVEIGEGLTSQGAVLVSGKISFTDYGYGYYNYTPIQIETNFTTSITGGEDSEYKEGGVLKDGTYSFTKPESQVNVTGKAGVDGSVNNITVNAAGNKLTITSDQTGITAADGKTVEVTAGNLTINGKTGIDAAGTVTINGDSTINGAVSVDGGTLNLNGKTIGQDVSSTGTVTVSGKGSLAANVISLNGGTFTGNGSVTSNNFLVSNGAKAELHGGTLSGIAGTNDSDGKSAAYVKGAGSSLNADNVTFKDGEIAADDGGMITLTGGSYTAADAWMSADGGTITASGMTINAGVAANANAAVTVNDGSVTAKEAGAYGANGVLTLKGGSYTIDNLTARNGGVAHVSGSQVVLKGITAGEGSSTEAVLTGDKSSLAGNVSGAGDVILKLTGNASWEGISADGQLDLTLDGSTWTNTGASQVGTFTGKNGVVDQSRHGGHVTIGNYSGSSVFLYDHDAKNPTSMIGGNVTIGSAAEGSTITLRTDSEGLNTASSNYQDKNLVSETLNALANKLYYTGWTKQEKNLSGKVEIAEGLTSQSAAIATGTVSYKDSGQGQYVYTPAVPDTQTKTDFTTSITGGEDREYKEGGVLKDGKYVFSAAKTTINAGKYLIAGGPWVPQISSAISGADAAHSVVVDMKGNQLDVHTTSDTHTTGITAIGDGKVEINNAGAMSVYAESTKGGQTAGLFANGGGTILVHNGGDGLESKVLTIRGNTTTAANGALIKTMNGKNGAESRIVVDGLVDVLADGDMSDKKGANEALSAVASTIEVGGGSIKAVNGAKYAIRAYGEFVSQNTGVVNVNVLKDKDGNITGAGTNKTVIEGSIATTGGMGTKGRISVGLSTKDSYWHGDYKDNTGYGVTPGQLGNVNLFMANGADWTGYSTGTMAVDMDSGATWHGYNTSDNFVLNLRNGAVWYNTNTTDKTSKLSYLTGGSDEAGAGVIDMTADGANDVSIGNYKGHTTVIYDHDSKNPNAVLGGSITIGSAAEGSSISLVTDNEGIAMNNEISINGALDALAHKLVYSAYVDGERHLAGYVKIAEGLTANSAVKQTGDIAFDETTGQGSLAEGSVKPGAEYPDSQITDTFSLAITGNEKTDIPYKQAGVLKNSLYTFTKSPTKITVDTGSAIDASKDVNVVAGDQRLYLKGAESGIYGKAGTTVNVSAAELHTEGGFGIKADGTINIKGISYVTGSHGTAVSASADGKVSLDTGRIEGNVVSDGGTITINQAESGNEVVVNGNVISADGGLIDLSLVGRTSSLTGGVTTETGDVTLRLKKGAVWNYNSSAETAASFAARAAQPKGMLTLEGGAAESEPGRIRYTGSKDLQIGKYSGHVIVEYDHTGDGSQAFDYKAGDIHISSAKENSSITLFTDSEGIDMSSKEKVGDILNTLASKLWYNGGNGALEASTQVAEGMTASSASWQGKIDYTEQGQGTLNLGSLEQIVKDPDIIYGPKETAMMRGAKSAMTTSMLSWRSTMSDMMSRMGDLRLSGETGGIWARTYGGRVSYDKSNTSVKNNFWGAQVGADRKLANGWHMGVAFDYNDGDASYELGGEGDPKLYVLSLYGTKLFADGQYLDLVVKAGRTENEYTVYNDMKHQLKGDYHANGYGISAEYGKRFGSDKGYVEPQIQLTLSRLGSTDYDAVSDYGGGKKMHVRQDGMNSFIGRLGITAGRSSEKGNLYVKASLAHEFAGSTSSTYSAENEPTSSVDQDFKDTWAELALGGNYKLNDNSTVYGELTKSFGGDYELEWKANLGIRFSF